MLDELMQNGERKLADKGMAFTGASSQPGNSPKITRSYFDSLMVEFRVIDAVMASTQTVFFGEEFSTPVMPAALSTLDRICPNGMVEVAKAAAEAGTLMWTGIGSEKELRAIVETGAKTVKIIKPYRDRDSIFEKIDLAEQCGAFAVGMDVCFGFGMKNGFSPAPMSPKSLDDLRVFIQSSKLPFIIKGVLSERDAVKALEAGAAGIVVSHQGGTVLDFAIPPVMVLPRIAKIINRKIPIFVDCGIASGMDAFKALALGASGVCVGKAIMAGLAVEGCAGVTKVLQSFTTDLQRVMSLTGAMTVDSIDPDVIWS